MNKPAVRSTRGVVSASPVKDDAAAPSDFVMLGGVCFNAVEIDSTQGLTGVVFDHVINEQVKLAPHLFSRIAVAQVSGQSKACIFFVDRTKVGSDDVHALVDVLRNNGYGLPSEGNVQGYFASSSIVIALSQGHISSDGLRVDRDIARNSAKNSLMSSFIDIIAWAYNNNADDIDFAVSLREENSQICFKIGGRYVRPPMYRLPTDTVLQMLGIAWQKSGGGASAQFQTNVEQQARLEIELPRSSRMTERVRVNLRWSGMAYDKGTVVTMRLQRLGDSAKIRSLADAGYFPSQMEVFRRVLKSEGGMTCLAGVVGSGKSTSLAALMHMLPDHLKKISIEDPAELEIRGMYQKTVTRDLASTGADPAFISAAKAIYRSALDVLLLGEIRDTTTGMLAREVSESGHSVYTTIHASSALGILDRMASPAIGIPREVLSSPSLIKLLVYQLLLPVTCPHCGKSPADHEKRLGLSGNALDAHHRYFDRIERLYNIDRARFRLRDERGCEHCRKEDLPELNGFAGRTVASEMVELDDRMLDLILAAKGVELHRYWRSQATSSYEDENLTGKTTMECAILKASRGIIDPREIEDRFMAFETVEIKRGAKGVDQ